MKFLDYPEQQRQGSQDFPYFFYHVTYIHPRYTMPYHWHPLCETSMFSPGISGCIWKIVNCCFLPETALLFPQASPTAARPWKHKAAVMNVC